MRIYTAALALEANTFSPLPTSWEAFAEKLHFPPGAHPAEPRHQTGAFWAARERAKDGRFTLVEGSCFAAQPGGPAATTAYERMRDTILAEITAALPLDGVVLALHGAMVAFGYDDCEGDLLERVRSLVGRGLRHRRRVRSALPSDTPQMRLRRHHHPVQGISAH